MEIVVNDTNILIDLIHLELLNDFLSLQFSFHTNEFIINEITDEEQRQVIDQLIEEGKLIIESHFAEEYTDILALKTKNLSFEDCSIWYDAQKLNGILLTGDARLRKSAEKAEVPVRGILFVFDQLVEQQLIEMPFAAEKLELLNITNHRLPKQEVEKRIELWKNNS